MQLYYVKHVLYQIAMIVMRITKHALLVVEGIISMITGNAVVTRLLIVRIALVTEALAQDALKGMVSFQEVA